MGLRPSRFCILSGWHLGHMLSLQRRWQLPPMGWVAAYHFRREMSGSSRLVRETTARPILPVSGEAQTKDVSGLPLIGSPVGRLHSSLLVRLVFGPAVNLRWFIYPICGASIMCAMDGKMQKRRADADRR